MRRLVIDTSVYISGTFWTGLRRLRPTLVKKYEETQIVSVREMLAILSLPQ